ncbi:hypothetical protein R6Q57_021974 [Mikania cordata]
MLSMSIHQGIKPLSSPNPNAVGFLKTPCLFKIHRSSSFSALEHRFHRLSVSAAVEEAIVAESPLPPIPVEEKEIGLMGFDIWVKRAVGGLTGQPT